MEIIFQGACDTDEANDRLFAMLRYFKERYQISQFREMHLSITLVDRDGYDVELVDTDTGQAYRVFEICTRENYDLTRRGTPNSLKLVVDNTQKHQSPPSK